jgi:hypothetical protein
LPGKSSFRRRVRRDIIFFLDDFFFSLGFWLGVTADDADRRPISPDVSLADIFIFFVDIFFFSLGFCLGAALSDAPDASSADIFIFCRVDIVFIDLGFATASSAAGELYAACRYLFEQQWERPDEYYSSVC